MARPYDDTLRERCARAIMKIEGFETTEPSLLAAAAKKNPRCQMWVNKADAVLREVFPRQAANRGTR